MQKPCSAPITAVLWLLVAAVPAPAQNFDVGADFLVGRPQNEFREKLDQTGYGAAGHFGYFLGRSPIMIGADFGYLNYGSERRWEPFGYTIPDVTLEVRTTNNIVMLHTFVRVQPQEGRVRPYAEALGGFKYLFTRTSVSDDSFGYPIASTTNFDDLAGSWGLGAGMDVMLWRQRQAWVSGRVFEISLNVSARYLWGSEAEYLKKGSIRRDPGEPLTYLVLHSTTDVLVPQIGVRVRF